MTTDVHGHTPLSEMNTTPLIDVLLVLLIMFIVTIPLQSHAVKLDLPGESAVVDSVSNKIVITKSGALQWNGEPVSKQQLSDLLATVSSIPDQPEVQLQPAALARYELVDEVLAMAKRAEVRRLGFVGNERYAHL